MTIFDQKGQTVYHQENYAISLNFRDVQTRAGALSELEKLQLEINKATQANLFDESTATDIDYKIKKALQEARGQNPEKKKIMDYLNDAKSIMGGISSAASIVPTIAEAIEAIKRIF